MALRIQTYWRGRQVNAAIRERERDRLLPRAVVYYSLITHDQASKVRLLEAELILQLKKLPFRRVDLVS